MMPRYSLFGVQSSMFELLPETTSKPRRKLAPRPCPASFDGDTFAEKRDGKRLKTLLERVYDLMADGKPRLLSDIARACGGSEASVSARLRDFRKPEHGGHTVNRLPVPRMAGTFKYQLLVTRR